MAPKRSKHAESVQKSSVSVQDFNENKEMENDETFVSVESPHIPDLKTLCSSLTSIDELNSQAQTKSGLFVVIDKQFFAPGEKIHFYDSVLELMVFDRHIKIIRMVANRNEAHKYQHLDAGLVVQFENCIAQPDNFSKFFGSPYPYQLKITQQATVTINEQLTINWKKFISHHQTSHSLATHIELFNGLLSVLKLSKITFPHPITVKGEHGFIATLSFETSDVPTKKVQLALFNDQIRSLPLLHSDQVYSIEHSHLKVKRPDNAFSDYDLAFSHKLSFTPLSTVTLSYPTMTLSEMISASKLPNIIETEVLLVENVGFDVQHSSTEFHVLHGLVADSSEIDGNLLTVVLDMVYTDFNETWKRGHALKGVFEVVEERHNANSIIRLRTSEQFIQNGSLCIERYLYKPHSYVFRQV
ncbi:hypothetical protein L596_021463 [Steinernema carpocapsae]|uniref:Uncharacterized protein n=1 Tax=Steinernema carpocapsae TaxID=34508 RepID=A0A4U5MIU8_STECR|nr:hypothetical protein L596_021463 [Steinernema carpocapsae]